MKCLGCYSEVKQGYCLPCRKKLFDKRRVDTVLPFAAPAADNITGYQQHTKQLSISGVQLKYSLSLENDHLFLTDKKGQYILKPIPPSQLALLQDVPENEHLTMQLAEQVFKIKTAPNALIHFSDGAPAYLTRRFDVRPNGQKYMQEDFAQLTQRTKDTHGEAFKYDGTYEEIGLLIKKYVAAAMPALERFFQLVVFNYVVSNGDAHLKNFSLIRNDNGEYVLSPAYDLMSTVLHTPNEEDTALDLYDGDINSKYYETYGCLGRENFMELSKRLGIVQVRAARIIDSFAAKHTEINTMVGQSFLSAQAKEKYISAVADRLKRLK